VRASDSVESQQLRVRRALAIAVVFVFAVQLVFDAQFLRATFPPEPGDGRDLLAFVTAGRIYASSDPGPAGVYDLESQRQVQEVLTGLTIAPGSGLPFMHPPHLLSLQAWLTRFSYTGYWLFWSCFSICCLLAGLGALGRALRGAGVPRDTFAVFAAAGLVFAPFVISIVHGQDTAFVYLGIAGWIAALLAGRDFGAGLALSLATLRPHLAIVLAVPFLFAKRRVFVGFVVGSSAWLCWALATVGIAGVLGFISAIASVAGLSEFGVDPRPMVNIAGLIRRLLPDSGLTAARVFAWMTWLGTLLFLCWRWSGSRSAGGPAAADLGLAVVLSLVFSPHLNFSDLAMLHAAAAPALLRARSLPAVRTPSLPSRLSAAPVILTVLLVSLLVSAATMSPQPLADVWLVAAYALALGLTVGALPKSRTPVRAGPTAPAS